MGPGLPGKVTLSVVIPIYNEKGSWRALLGRVAAVAIPGIAKEILLVDDGSTDGTRQELQELARDPAGGLAAAGGEGTLRVLFHERNRGKGAGLRTGFAAATGDLVAIQDADLEYDPADFPRLLEPLRKGQADVVYGSRFSAGRPAQSSMRNYLANRFLTWFSNRRTGLRLSDMETCYKVFRREILLRLELEQDRFGFEPEFTGKVARLGLRVAEVPIRYAGRSRAEGKKIGWKDGFQALWCILKYSRRKPRGQRG